MKKPKKILLLGSGGLKIGQAGEFDYSGSQAIKALKEEGISTVLLNPNIATIQTSEFLADSVYFLPITDEYVESIIQKEKPDGIFLSFGGQTALNCGISLYKKGIFKKYNVEIYGTPIEAIILTEDRNKFAKHLAKIDIKTPISKTAQSKKEAIQIAKTIGFPIMVRSGFALGGLGSGIAQNEEQLLEIAEKAFAFSPQILVEQYLHHFKEVEYEVVRDKYDNCITVCNMENLDPLGIHTGDSIVVAPSQTLTNFEYHYLRSVSIKIVRSLGIVGECNVQFALNPNPTITNKAEQAIDYYTIEVNARLSRSSALASKATGYPLAYVAAKLGLGYGLTEIKNSVTQVTQACFEPALDYVVVKIPRWDMEKFKGSDNTIGTSMKSVGEVMGIGRTFEESYQKAIRMLDLDLEGAVNDKILKNGTLSKGKISHNLSHPTPKRMFFLTLALRKSFTIKQIHKLTGVDPWFLHRLKNIVDKEKSLSKKKLTDISKTELLELKQLGFSDKRIGEIVSSTGLAVRSKRKKLDITPSILQIDTLAGEFPAKTNYLYMTYNATHNDITPLGKDGVLVLGSGPYRIGSSVEFDWTCVNTVRALSRHKKKSIVINCNPETVSTDYDVSDRLYFEELTFERIADIYEFENSFGTIVSVGGQTPNNRAQSLQNYGVPILGTKPEDIQRAEDRGIFSSLCDSLEISQPPWNNFTNIKDALSFCKKVGYPVLIRPSFVLSGTGMKVCYDKEAIKQYLGDGRNISKDYPITVSKFVINAKELEFDAVASNGKIVVSAISEHVENAGVHSGDATIVFPTQKVYSKTERQIEKIACKLAKALSISGPFNIQFLAKDNELSVIEINVRSSRTFPFISKVTGINFMDYAVDAFFNKNVPKIDIIHPNFIAVKVAQFSFARLAGADPILHVEMMSTGEVACFGETIEEAYMKGEMSVGGIIPQTGIFISLGGETNKAKSVDALYHLANINLPIYATEKTRLFLKKHGVKAIRVYKIHEKKTPNILALLQSGKIDLTINVPEVDSRLEVEDNITIRRIVIDHNIQLITDIKKAELFIKALSEMGKSNYATTSWKEYSSREDFLTTR